MVRPYSTWESANISVVQVMVAPEVMILVDCILEITGKERGAVVVKV